MKIYFSILGYLIIAAFIVMVWNARHFFSAWCFVGGIALFVLTLIILPKYKNP